MYDPDLRTAFPCNRWQVAGERTDGLGLVTEEVHVRRKAVREVQAAKRGAARQMRRRVPLKGAQEIENSIRNDAPVKRANTQPARSPRDGSLCETGCPRHLTAVSVAVHVNVADDLRRRFSAPTACRARLR